MRGIRKELARYNEIFRREMCKDIQELMTNKLADDIAFSIYDIIDFPDAEQISRGRLLCMNCGLK